MNEKLFVKFFLPADDDNHRFVYCERNSSRYSNSLHDKRHSTASCEREWVRWNQDIIIFLRTAEWRRDGKNRCEHESIDFFCMRKVGGLCALTFDAAPRAPRPARGVSCWCFFIGFSVCIKELLCIKRLVDFINSGLMWARVGKYCFSACRAETLCRHAIMPINVRVVKHEKADFPLVQAEAQLLCNNLLKDYAMDGSPFRDASGLSCWGAFWLWKHKRAPGSDGARPHPFIRRSWSITFISRGNFFIKSSFLSLRCFHDDELWCYCCRCRFIKRRLFCFPPLFRVSSNCSGRCRLGE